MAENTVFLLLTALIRNFYKFLMGRQDTKAFGLKKTSRIKAFVFKFISVPAKWIRTARLYQLNIYTHSSTRTTNHIRTLSRPLTAENPNVRVNDSIKPL